MSGAVHEQLPADRSGRVAGKRLNLPRSTRVRTAIIALGICVAAIAGCASPAQPESATPPAVSNPGVVTPSSPPALSPTAYQETLQSANSAMAPAFDRLATSGSSEDARAALDQASSTQDRQRCRLRRRCQTRAKRQADCVRIRRQGSEHYRRADRRRQLRAVLHLRNGLG